MKFAPELHAIARHHWAQRAFWDRYLPRHPIRRTLLWMKEELRSGAVRPGERAAFRRAIQALKKHLGSHARYSLEARIALRREGAER